LFLIYTISLPICNLR